METIHEFSEMTKIKLEIALLRFYIGLLFVFDILIVAFIIFII